MGSRKKSFDLTTLRDRLDGDFGYRWSLGGDTQLSRSVGGLATTARADIHVAVQCLMVGYDNAARQLLSRAQQLLHEAILECEHPQAYAVDGTEAERHLSLAFCNWLLNNCQDNENYERYVYHSGRFLSSSQVGRDPANISLTMPHYVDAGALEDALNLFACAKMSPPASLHSIQDEAQMCYVLCRFKLHRQYASTDTESAVEHFFERRVQSWLLDGDFFRAAEWMKIAYWQRETRSPAPSAVVRRCLAHVPAQSSE